MLIFVKFRYLLINVSCIRVSTEEQAREGFSIIARQDKLKDYIRIKGWELYDFKDGLYETTFYEGVCNPTFKDANLFSYQREFRIILESDSFLQNDEMKPYK